jgi:hypothetical protein
MEDLFAFNWGVDAPKDTIGRLTNHTKVSGYSLLGN